MNFQECELGFTFQNSKVCVFFGKVTCAYEALQDRFTHFEFFQIKQIHSDIIVEAGPNLQTADAHWTSKTNKALVIRTADCIPAFIFNPQTNVVAGIHAGWRGVENQIVPKTLNMLFEPTAPDTQFEVWIGPHILQESFEVELEVMQKLIVSSYGFSQADVARSTGNKFKIDLKKIVDSQIAHSKIKHTKTYFLSKDSKIDTQFHSYRRDGNSSGRNLSFIALI